MAINAIEWAFEQDVAIPSAKLVLLSLADHANATGYCWPSIARLSKRTGLSRATIFRSIETLTGLGLVAQSYTQGKVNKYTLILPVSLCDQSHDDTSITMIPHPSHGETTPVSSCDQTRLMVRPEPSLTTKEPSMKRARAISADWEPDDKLLAWAVERAPNVDTNIESEKFINYYLSKGDARKDWAASWRNWIIRATRDYTGGGSRFPTRGDTRRTRNSERIDAAMARRDVSSVSGHDNVTGLRDVPTLRLVVGSESLD